MNGSSTPKTEPKEVGDIKCNDGCVLIVQLQQTPAPAAPMNGMVDESWQMRAEERQRTIHSLQAELEQHKKELVNLRLEVILETFIFPSNHSFSHSSFHPLKEI